MTIQATYADSMRPWTILGLVAAASGSINAQMVDVRLRDVVSKAPIVGTLVRLLADSLVVGQAITNGDGQATLRAPSPGLYRVRVNRIGYSAVLTDPLLVGIDQTVTKEIAMTSAAISLPALRVETKSECGGPISDGAVAGAIWEQVRTALATNDLTQRQRAVLLTVRTFHRDLSLDLNSVREVVTGAYTVRGPPFVSPAASTLEKNGYAVLVGDEMTFGAPDAALLLTDEFSATHCFRAVPGPTEAIVGLAFEPAPRRRLSDIRGTLWVNRQTSELQFIEYGYTNLPAKLANVGLGGRIDFRRLPTGEWIVSYWHIRMPRMDQPPDDYRSRRAFEPHLAGYVEDGARVTVGAPTTSANAVVLGRIFDSTTLAPLPGAVVRIQGDSDSATTEADGRFVLRTAVGGARTIAATHPKLGLIDDGSIRPVSLSVGDSTVVDFSVPTATRIAHELCGPASNRSGLVGLTWSGGVPTENLELRISWEPTPGAPEEERARSGARGFYAVCDLPAGQVLTVRVQRGAEVLVEQKVTIGMNEFRWLDLRGLTK